MQGRVALIINWLMNGGEMLCSSFMEYPKILNNG